MLGWVGGVPASGGDLHLLRSEVEGTGGCFFGIGTQSVQINRPFLSVVIDLGTPKPGRSATRKTLPESERSSARNNVGIHWSVLPKS